MKFDIPLEIPPFDDINISREEMIQCKNLFEELANAQEIIRVNP
jgi:hypothetical protein